MEYYKIKLYKIKMINNTYNTYNMTHTQLISNIL